MERLDTLRVGHWAIIIASAGFVFGTAVERILGRAAHIERYGLIVLVVIGLGVWLYHRWKEKREAIPSVDGE